VREDGVMDEEQVTARMIGFAKWCYAQDMETLDRAKAEIVRKSGPSGPSVTVALMMLDKAKELLQISIDGIDELATTYRVETNHEW
jgi:hypothetical protein